MKSGEYIQPDLEKALQWIKRNTYEGKGIAFSTKRSQCSKVSTAALIPSLVAVGEDALARQYAAWLCKEQQADGSFEFGGEVFNPFISTCQVILGWMGIVASAHGVLPHLKKSARWLARKIGSETSLEAEKLIGLVCLTKLAAYSNDFEFLKPEIDKHLQGLQADKFLEAWQEQSPAYDVQILALNALFDLGFQTTARIGMLKFAGQQTGLGAIPAQPGVQWVSISTLALAAEFWRQLSCTDRVNKALNFLGLFQNPGGGFFGSYGVDANFFPDCECSWSAASVLKVLTNGHISIEKANPIFPVKKEIRRLAVVPSDPLQAYVAKGRESLLQDYYNPGGFFDEVYCLSPLETEEVHKYGMVILPTKAEELAGRLRDLDIDVIRAYGGYWACDFACQNKAAGTPVVVSVHDTNPDLLFESIKQADFVMCVSNPVRNLVLSKGVLPGRIIPFANRVDLDIFKPSRDPQARSDFEKLFPGKYRILHIGRRQEEKNLDTLIKALAYLPEEYTAIFIGQGDLEPFTRLARENNVVDRCHFIDSIPNQLLPEYYSFCDCFCTPSRWEGFGIVFIEAMACEAVVVTSDIAPMNEFITNGVSGVLVKNYEDPLSLAMAIRRVCTYESLRKKLKSNARQAVLPFSKEKIDELEANIYRDVLKTRSAAIV